MGQRSRNAINERGCRAISPSAFAFNEEDGALTNSNADIPKPGKQFFFRPRQNRGFGNLRNAQSGQGTDYAREKAQKTTVEKPKGSGQTPLEPHLTNQMALTEHNQ